MKGKKVEKRENIDKKEKEGEGEKEDRDEWKVARVGF